MLKQSYSGFSLEAGTDEAGRGCLSGPVVAAAVILPKDFSHPFLTDSKQLSEKKRDQLKPVMIIIRGGVHQKIEIKIKMKLMIKTL